MYVNVSGKNHSCGTEILKEM